MSDRWNEVEETSGKTGLHFERVGNRTESLLPKGERSMTYEDYDNLDDRADRMRLLDLANELAARLAKAEEALRYYAGLTNSARAAAYFHDAETPE